ncbi:unnamed protein product [Mytilus edulis]|uniref:Uncharacterized protein n=1 Tax=Mytilus edulis TaxID=6550 RepID=A0A8S3RQB8_MYTED|nr:unnamed protein product [Mytilus edulis]
MSHISIAASILLHSDTKRPRVQPATLTTRPAPKEEFKISPTDFPLPIQTSVQPSTVVTRAPTTILLTTELPSRSPTPKFVITTTEFPKPDVTITPQNKPSRPNTTPPKPLSYSSVSKLYTTTKQPSSNKVLLTTKQPTSSNVLLTTNQPSDKNCFELRSNHLVAVQTQVMFTFYYIKGKY